MFDLTLNKLSQISGSRAHSLLKSGKKCSPEVTRFTLHVRPRSKFTAWTVIKFVNFKRNMKEFLIISCQPC